MAKREMLTNCKTTAIAKLIAANVVVALSMPPASARTYTGFPYPQLEFSYPISTDHQNKIRAHNVEGLYAALDCHATEIKSRTPLESIPARRVIFLAKDGGRFIFPAAVDIGSDADWEGKKFVYTSVSAIVFFLDWELKDEDLFSEDFDFPRSLDGKMGYADFGGNLITLEVIVDIGEPTPYTFGGEMRYQLDRRNLSLRINDSYSSTLQYRCGLVAQDSASVLFGNFIEYQNYYIQKMYESVLEMQDETLRDRKF